MTVKTPSTPLLAGEIKFALNEYERVGKASVGFKPAMQTVLNTVIGDSMYYDPVDSDPEFITAMRLIKSIGSSAEPETYSCTVRTPHARLNEPQEGLFTVGSPAKNLNVTLAYLNGGSLTGLPTCTLTRVK